jgi:hypothetical protein
MSDSAAYELNPRIQRIIAFGWLLQVLDICNDNYYAEHTRLTQGNGAFQCRATLNKPKT